MLCRAKNVKQTLQANMNNKTVKNDIQ